MTDDELRAMLDAATPGPWGFYPLTFDDLQGKPYETGYEVINKVGAFVHRRDLWSGIDREKPEQWADFEVRGNARLIAAAPDLAAEVLRLRAALRACLSHIEWDEDEYGEVYDAGDTARAALGDAK